MHSGKVNQFDPFESRLCRTVRNDLGQAFLAVLPGVDMAAVLNMARVVTPADADPAVGKYVDTRIERYRAVFNDIRSVGKQAADTWFIASLLWDQALFFECHEWLEKKWLRSEGAEKQMVQALIWAAGAYSHLEYGRIAAAGKLAARAVSGLLSYREQVPAPFDIDVLVKKLEIPDPTPPRFVSRS